MRNLKEVTGQRLPEGGVMLTSVINDESSYTLRQRRYDTALDALARVQADIKNTNLRENIDLALIGGFPVYASFTAVVTQSVVASLLVGATGIGMGLMGLHRHHFRPEEARQANVAVKNLISPTSLPLDHEVYQAKINSAQIAKDA